MITVKVNVYELTNSYRYLNGFYKDNLNDDWTIRSGLSYTYLRKRHV